MFKRRQKDKTRRRGRGTFFVKKSCRFCKDSTNKDKIKGIDYKDVGILSRYITEQGKILPSRISGSCSYHQKQLAKAIKRARAISLLPYTRE